MLSPEKIFCLAPLINNNNEKSDKIITRSIRHSLRCYHEKTLIIRHMKTIGDRPRLINLCLSTSIIAPPPKPVVVNQLVKNQSELASPARYLLLPIRPAVSRGLLPIVSQGCLVTFAGYHSSVSRFRCLKQQVEQHHPVYISFST